MFKAVRRPLPLLLALFGSWKFWCGTALAGTAVAIATVVLYKTVWANPGDAGSYPYYRLVSNVGQATASNPNPSERILLMNSDRDERCFVDCENFTGVTSASKAARDWWEFLNDDAVKLTGYNLVKGTYFKVHEKGANGRTLWECINCRGGNLNPTTTAGKLKNYQNALSFGPTSYSRTVRTLKANQTTAGTLVMQNTPDAQVISGCLKDGIGTIYFDAVNGFNQFTSGQLGVEVAYGVWATNTDGAVSADIKDKISKGTIFDDPNWRDYLARDAAGNLVPPDDANIHEYHIVNPAPDLKVNTNAYARVAWVRAQMSGHWWCNGAEGVVPTGTVFNPKMPESGTAAGTFDNFYRIWAPVQDDRINPDLAPYCRGPMRFRIKRLDDPQTAYTDPMGIEGENFKDENWKPRNGLLILDNIIASFPAMMASAVPRGEYAAGGSSRNVIGWTGVLRPEGHEGAYYPKAGDRNLSAAAGLSFKTNAVPDEAAGPAWIDGLTATMSYRWRYLARTNGWEDITLTVQDGEFRSSAPIALPDLLGDIEFFYRTELDAPYYGYVDYSGKNAGTPGYTERIKSVESRFDAASLGPKELPSLGEDFFFRMREGVSTQLENQVVFRWKAKPGDEEYTTASFPCQLVADGLWKTFVRTTTNAVAQAGALRTGSYEFRVEGVNPRTVFGGADVTAVPWSGQPLVRKADTEEAGWASITLDSVTGAVMFMLTEGKESGDEMSLSIVHADYQDFSTWTDAKTDGGLYTGAFFEGRGKKSGASPDSRTYPSELPDWQPTAVSNATYWTEVFYPDNETKDPIKGYKGNPAYASFAESLTPNSWKAYNSMWVCSKWRQAGPGGDMALQLAGFGDGSVEYINSKELPHGIEEVRLKARLAQAADFGDFAIYDAGTSSDQKDYVFSIRAIMRLNTTADEFDGNGTVSAIGYYRAEKGCYELRAERIDSDTIRLNLYKWKKVSRTKAVATLLGYHSTTLKANTESYMRSNGTAIPANESVSTYYGELFIRCVTASDNQSVTITAGLMNGAKKLSEGCSGISHCYLTYEDSDDPITYGRFGFDSLNCPAQFVDARKYAKGLDSNFPKKDGKPKDADGKDIDKTYFKCGSGGVTYTGTPENLFVATSEGGQRIYKNWTIREGKYTVRQDFAESHKGVTADDPTGELELFVTENGGGTSSKGTQPVSGFKFNDVKFTVRNDADSFVKLATAADSEDVVVDNVVFSQWCADSYDSGDNPSFARKDWASGSPLNYAYVNGWVTVDDKDNHAIVLQPLRAKDGGVVTVRAPLMDGRNDGKDESTRRGRGLGMIGFTYRNAHSNCVVQLQYRAIDGAGDGLRNATRAADGWITAVETNFLHVAAEDLAKGTVSAYLGQHDIRGAMRIVIKPEVVADARDPEKNPDGDPLWGSIEIVDFVSRDAPGLDGRCWWGWNLRTSDAEDERSIYDSLPAEAGLALALNNSTEADTAKDPENPGETAEERKERFAQNLPFVQTPNFGADIAGEISFRARRMPDATPDQYTEVAILGVRKGSDPDRKENWNLLKTFVISNDCYSSYTYKTRNGDECMAFRLAVIGVAGVTPNYSDKRQLPGAVHRVLLDEVSVSEAVRGKVGFFEVGAFRTPLDKHEYVTNLFDIVQQPMCEESWSVQCEIRAVQLEEEIRLGDDTSVTMYWIATNHDALTSANWGWENWKDRAKSAPLARIADRPGFFFRGSYPQSGTAIIDPSYVSGTVVQYMLEAHYRTADGDDATQVLSSGEWTKPAWFRGVDYNGRFGGFAAYTILDTVAYGYAWINEVNVYDGPTPETDISPTNQYVEIALPESANISGWQLQFITGGLDENPNDPIYTNVVATFTDDPALWSPGLVPSTKDFSLYGDMDSTYVFLAVGNKASATEAMTRDHYIDGVWEVDPNDRIGPQLTRSTGYIDCGSPIGIRLVRPSGVVEHEIVVAGTNRWDFYGPPYTYTYSATNFLARMRRLEPDGSWTCPCPDSAFPQDYGLSVTNSASVTTDASVWAHWRKTPGRVNECDGVKEYISSDYPKPQGTLIRLYAQLQGGYIDQTIGEFVATVSNVVLFVPKDLWDGTNITYHVTNCWHELASVTETGKDGTREHPDKTGEHGRGTVVVPVAVHASNDVKVVAKTRVRADIDALLGPDNDYREAVVKWLEAGKRGPRSGRRDFENPGEIHLAAFHGYSHGYVRDLNLTEMYWLDLDPTLEGTVFQAGMCDPPQPTKPHIGPGEGTELDRTDIVLGVFMKIWNENGEFEPYAPYTLNGIEPGQSTMDHPADWNSVTFKITGHLVNGLDDTKDPAKVWMPLRYFVFDENSFENFKSTIQVEDPFVQFSDWKPYADCPVFFRWDIDTRKFGAVGNDLLRPDSTFKE